jgi:UPF0716 protein FxsA
MVHAPRGGIVKLWRLLPLAFLVVPIVEIAVIIQVGQLIGLIPTIALLLVESALGAWLVKREGSQAWVALTSSVRTGHLPTRELTDAALVLVGGTLLLTPGFVTDVFGFFLILPFTRPVARRALQGWVARRAVQATVGRPPTSTRTRGSGSTTSGSTAYGTDFGPRPGPAPGPVVPGEVVEPGRDDPKP